MYSFPRKLLLLHLSLVLPYRGTLYLSAIAYYPHKYVCVIIVPKFVSCYLVRYAVFNKYPQED